jgi:adenosylhomocysteine nucleosidase
MTRRLAIVAALPGELKPLVRGWQRQGEVFRARIGSSEAFAVALGMGASAAGRACDLLLREKPDALVSMGWAGSLSCGLKPPQAVGVREVIDAATGESFPTGNPEGQRLITLGRVADAQEKRRLAQQYQAVLVDMEAAAAARVACSQGLAFYCFKGVSDGPNDRLPDFNRFVDAEGQLRMPTLIAYTATHPQYWGPLRTLGTNSRLAARELALFVDGFFAASQ